MVEETLDAAGRLDDENASQPFPVRFQLWHVFYATALIAICCALSVWLLIPAAIWFFVCGSAAKQQKSGQRLYTLINYSIWGTIVSCCLGVVLVAPAVGVPHHAAIRTTCANNMQQIMLAVINYESSHHHFPTPTETDSDGKPMHSWRVRILPFIEQQKLYDQYDFDQPWDSADNLKLVDQMPAVFGCPFSKETNRTYYKLVVGPGSLFDGVVDPTYGSIRDGTSNTIALVEDAVNPVEWTRPADLTIEEALKVLKPDTAEHFPHVTDWTFETQYQPGNVARFDGSTDYGGDCCELRESEVRKMLAIDDGRIVEDIRDPECVCGKSVNKITPWIALGFFFLLMLYPLSWIFRRSPAGSIDITRPKQTSTSVAEDGSAL